MVIGGIAFKIPIASVTEIMASFIAIAAASAPVMPCTSDNTVVNTLNTFDETRRERSSESRSPR